MAVYYKFKSARDYDSIPMDGPFISVGVLKERIFESKHLGRGTDFDLVVTNAQSNEEYLDEAMLIPKNTSVLIRRVPGRPRMPIVTEQEPSVQKKIDDTPPEKSGYTAPDSMASKYTDETEWDEFGNDLYSIPDALPVVSMNTLPEAPPTNNADEDSKIKALIETPALDWQRQGADGFGPGRGFGRGMGGRMGGRGFGLERKTPPQGYVCHRCKVPGHFIQHCPTNGDPNYDVKRVKPPTGIPKSMLMQTTDGSYALPSGAVAVLKPNEAAFEKEMEGLPSNRTVGDLPPELHCPLCREVMKDAVLTSKCCFKSFCDKCIRDHIISKAQCICGATNVLADDLLPNKTLRDTIERILESGNSSAENAGSTFQAQDMESARCPQPKMPSPTTSAASRGEHNPPIAKEEAPDTDIIHRNSTKNMAEPVRVPLLVQERAKSGRMADVSEATHESMSFKEPAASQGSALLAEEEVQQKLAPGDAAKKKKKKKVRVPPNDMWKAPHDMAAENFMMPMGQPSFNPFWNGFQPGMEGYMAPFAAPMPMMGYGLGPFDMPFPGAFPPDPFAAQGFMMPGMPPQRDLAELGMGMNAGPPAMSREEFEARKADVRRRREMERRADREFPRDREFGREVNSGGDISSMKSRPGPQSSSATHRPHRPERPSPDRPPRDIDFPPPPPPRPSKRKPDHSGDRDRDYHDRPRERDTRDRQREHDPRDHDRDRERERDRDRERERERDRDRHRDHHRSETSAPPPPPASATMTSSQAAAAAAAAAEKKHKASVFSRISFISGGGEAASKKRKASEGVGGGSGSHHKGSSSSLAPGGNGYYHEESTKPSMGSKKARSSSGATGKEYESSDEEDRHFKRKPSRYEPSPPPTGEEEEMWDAAGEGDLKRHRSSSRDRKHR